MAVRVKPQPSTKWWFLLAALIASLCTLIEVASRTPAEDRSPRGRASEARGLPEGDWVEIEIEPN